MSILGSLGDEARVWLYQTDRPLTDVEQTFISKQLSEFLTQWNAHGTKLTADATVLNPCFVAFAVDESNTLASGCSIDSSVKFLKALGAELKVDFFTRMKACILDKEELQQVSLHELSSFSEDVLIFDPLINNLGELRTNWLRPLKTSSLSSFAI